MIVKGDVVTTLILNTDQKPEGGGLLFYPDAVQVVRSQVLILKTDQKPGCGLA